MSSAALPANKKGDPLQAARIAGIMAAKKTSDLIPLCHQLPLSHVSLEFALEEFGVRITATAATTAQTGVEMEALTAASIAALTIYDMTKALDKAIEIREIYLLEKTGGKYGRFPASGSMIPRVAILTISDSAVSGTRLDTSGPALREHCLTLGWPIAAESIVADEAAFDSRRHCGVGRHTNSRRDPDHRRHRRGPSRCHSGSDPLHSRPRNSRRFGTAARQRA